MNDIRTTDIRFLKGIGDKRAECFRRLGIETVADLLSFYPRAYEDWQNITPITEASENQTAAVKGIMLAKPVPVRTRSGKLMYRSSATDGKGIMHLTFFNNRYVADDLKEGQEFIFYGKVKINDMGAKEMLSPRYLKAETGEKLHPVYPETRDLNSKAIAKAVKTALDTFGTQLTETLPAEQILKYKLPSYSEAIRMIHFPHTEGDIKSARRRLIYEELLILQLGILSSGKKDDEITDCIIQKDFTEEFLEKLPFAPTSAQRRAIKECISDMKMHSPMRRLLQGDVGSGKTAVAAALMYCTVKNSYQCALMAPTEVLARQHLETFNKFLDGTGIKTVLLTGSTTAKNKRIIKEQIASGEAHIIIGTHAVITDDTHFKNLGLVITDEQHRFGVNQRAALREKGSSPHVLVMSATPIPRTLSLIIYGDLSISVLDEKPKGRKDVKTYSVPSHYHERLYNFIKKEVQKGNRCYIVCPMVEENEETDIDLKSAEEYYKLLSETVFSDIKCGLLHGKMKQSKKDETMTAFKNGDIQVLICTIVIEVGIDVPEANVIVIENAERFRLSQLHQLRGRVGRGTEESHCILVSDSKNEDTKKRLDIMCQTCDGFKISEEDLKMRGPGDFFGSRQSGLPTLKIASLMTDSRILYAARDEAEKILEEDPHLESLKNNHLKRKISLLFADIS